MPLLAANWKMYKGPRETLEFCAAFRPPEGIEAVLCPPFVSLAAAVESGHTIFAQNVHWADEGAFTGEVSAPMLKEVGASGSIGESGQTELVLRLQVEAIADAAGAHDDLVLAYEPVWAIGTGKTATPEQAQDAHAFIKEILDVPVLYGGSVKPDNAAEMLARPGIDGALVGGASLEVESFTAICQAAEESRS